MYQTVGHTAIDYYAEATGLPLFKRLIKGTSLSTGSSYEPHNEDEVEDMFHLLENIKVCSEMVVHALVNTSDPLTLLEANRHYIGLGTCVCVCVCACTCVRTVCVCTQCV